MKLSPLEIELGFEEVEILGLIDPYEETPQRRAALVLNDSDIIVMVGNCDDPTYQHRRYGRFENLTNFAPAWLAISNLFGSHASDPRNVIADAKFGADEIGQLNVVLPVKADIKRTTKP